MDDLISRSAVKEEIESLQMIVTGLRAGKGVLLEFMKQYKESVLRIIDEQPTAYNMDKVVEEVSNISSLVRPVGWSTKQEVVLTKDAIEKIKAGGVNES